MRNVYTKDLLNPFDKNKELMGLPTMKSTMCRPVMPKITLHI